jgi:hypothetical protein
MFLEVMKLKHTYLSVQPLNTTLFSFGVAHPRGVYLELHTLYYSGAGRIHKRCGVYKNLLNVHQGHSGIFISITLRMALRSQRCCSSNTRSDRNKAYPEIRGKFAKGFILRLRGFLCLATIPYSY